jgi:hypothetical protein
MDSTDIAIFFYLCRVRIFALMFLRVYWSLGIPGLDCFVSTHEDIFLHSFNVIRISMFVNIYTQCHITYYIVTRS